MYSVICKLTDDTRVAEEILIDTFLQLKEKQLHSKVGYPLCAHLLRHTYNCTIFYLKALGLNPKTTQLPLDTKLIPLICSSCNSLEEVALKLNISNEKALKKLQLEFLELRNYKIMEGVFH